MYMTLISNTAKDVVHNTNKKNIGLLEQST